MIEIKFDSNNEVVLIQHLKDLFSKNPILLQNIVEPCVNGMISDVDVPKQIKEKIREAVQACLTPETIKSGFESALPEILVEQGISSTIDEVVTSIVEADSGIMHDRIQDALTEAIDGEIDSSAIEDAINERVDQDMRGISVDGMVDEAITDAIGELNIEDKVDTAIRDYFRRDLNVEETINTAVSEMVEEHADPESVKLTVRELINSKISSVGETKLIEIIKEVLITNPELKKLAEQQTVLPVMEKRTSPGMDTLLIGIKPEATASFMWMIKGLMNEKTIEIQKVNGV